MAERSNKMKGDVSYKTGIAVSKLISICGKVEL